MDLDRWIFQFPSDDVNWNCFPYYYTTKCNNTDTSLLKRALCNNAMCTAHAFFSFHYCQIQVSRTGKSNHLCHWHYQDLFNALIFQIFIRINRAMYPTAIEVVAALQTHAQSSPLLPHRGKFLEILRNVQDGLQDQQHDNLDVHMVRCINLEGKLCTASRSI